jgi:hypothetical protein
MSIYAKLFIPYKQLMDIACKKHSHGSFVGRSLAGGWWIDTCCSVLIREGIIQATCGFRWLKVHIDCHWSSYMSVNSTEATIDMPFSHRLTCHPRGRQRTEIRMMAVSSRRRNMLQSLGVRRPWNATIRFLSTWSLVMLAWIQKEGCFDSRLWEMHGNDNRRVESAGSTQRPTFHALTSQSSDKAILTLWDCHAAILIMVIYDWTAIWMLRDPSRTRHQACLLPHASAPRRE